MFEHGAGDDDIVRASGLRGVEKPALELRVRAVFAGVADAPLIDIDAATRAAVRTADRLEQQPVAAAYVEHALAGPERETDAVHPCEGDIFERVLLLRRGARDGVVVVKFRRACGLGERPRQQPVGAAGRAAPNDEGPAAKKLTAENAAFGFAAPAGKIVALHEIIKGIHSDKG